MTDQPQPRKHLAKRWWGKNGLIIRCTCGQWESRGGDTRRQQDDAHRAHRIDMGETVRPRKLTRVEQMEAEVRRLTAELEQARQQTETIAGIVALHLHTGWHLPKRTAEEKTRAKWAAGESNALAAALHAAEINVFADHNPAVSGA